jgi:hypothetical protein
VAGGSCPLELLQKVFAIATLRRRGRYWKWWLQPPLNFYSNPSLYRKLAWLT